MSRSRLILFAWLLVAVPTAAFYSLACFGTTHCVLGPLDIWVNTLVSVSWESPGGIDAELFSWDDPGFVATPGPWHRAILAEFDFIWDDRFLLEFPLWFPLLLATLILAPLYLRHRKREARLFPNNQ